MTTIPLFRAHSTRHAKPKTARKPGRLRALIAAVELRLAWWEWPPVQAHYLRRYKRADRKAFAAEMAAIRSAAPAGGGVDEDGLERYRDEPLHDGLAAKLGEPPRTTWHQPLPELPDSHPYPLPTWMPRRIGDGLIALTPDGCVQVRRPLPGWATETACDMPAVHVGRYLDEMPGGTE